MTRPQPRYHQSCLPDFLGTIVAFEQGRIAPMAARNGKTVLIVENQPNYTQLLVKQILFAGLDPVVAITGNGGLRKAYECHPDLILLEIELSDMNGLELVAQLRQRPEADRIPIVAMSTFTNRKAQCLQSGCDDFLQKPIKMIELMGRIKKFLPGQFSPRA